MRIGVLTTSFPRHAGDPAGAFVLGCAQALAARGHTLEVLAPQPAEHLPVPTFVGVDLTWVPYAPARSHQRTFYGAGVPDNLARAPAAALGVGTFAGQLYRTAKKRAPDWDAVMSHWCLPCGLVASAVAGPRPHLSVCHSADVFALRAPGVGRVLRRWIVARGTRFWFVSPYHQQLFMGDLPARLTRAAVRHVGPMGVAPDNYGPEREASRKRLGMTGFCVLALARLVPIKGLADAIRALSHWPEAELWLAGDGPSGPALRHLAARLGVRLRVLGTVHGEAKWRLLSAADALVVPSRPSPFGRTEGFPTTITEAHAAGLPVVASATGGIGGTLIHGHDALLVPPRSPARLRDALLRLWREPELRQRLRRTGRLRATSLAWPVLAPKIEGLLEPDAPVSG